MTDPYRIEGPAIIHKSWCPHPDSTDYVRVKGDSMEPGIPDPNSKATRLGMYNLDPAVRFWATPPIRGVLSRQFYVSCRTTS